MNYFIQVLVIGFSLFSSANAFAEASTCTVGSVKVAIGQKFQSKDGNTCTCQDRIVGGVSKPAIGCTQTFSPNPPAITGCMVPIKAGPLPNEVALPPGLKMDSVDGSQSCECVGTKLSCEPKSKNNKPSVTACLKALNEKSVALKGKVTVIDEGSFVVKEDDGTMQVATEKGIYKIESKPTSKCTPRSDVKAAEVIQSLVVRTTALGNDSGNSTKNKMDIVKACQGFADAPQSKSSAEKADIVR